MLGESSQKSPNKFYNQAGLRINGWPSQLTLCPSSVFNQFLQIRWNLLKGRFSIRFGLFAGLQKVHWFVTPTCETNTHINHFWKVLFLVQLVPADDCMSDLTTDRLWVRMTLIQLADDCSLSLLTNSERCTIIHLQAGPSRPNTCLTPILQCFFWSTVVKTGSGKYDSWQAKSDSDLSNGGENTPKKVYY